MHTRQVLELTNGEGSKEQMGQLEIGINTLYKQGKLDDSLIEELDKRLTHWKDEDRVVSSSWGVLYKTVYKENGPAWGEKEIHPILKIFRKFIFYRSSRWEHLNLLADSPYAQVLKEVQFIRCDEMLSIAAFWGSTNFINVEKIEITKTIQSDREIDIFLENQANFSALKTLIINGNSLWGERFERLKNGLNGLTSLKEDEYGRYWFEFHKE